MHCINVLHPPRCQGNPKLFCYKLNKLLRTKEKDEHILRKENFPPRKHIFCVYTMFAYSQKI